MSGVSSMWNLRYLWVSYKWNNLLDRQEPKLLLALAIQADLVFSESLPWLLFQSSKILEK